MDGACGISDLNRAFSASPAAFRTAVRPVYRGPRGRAGHAARRASFWRRSSVACNVSIARPGLHVDPPRQASGSAPAAPDATRARSLSLLFFPARGRHRPLQCYY